MLDKNNTFENEVEEMLKRYPANFLKGMNKKFPYEEDLEKYVEINAELEGLFNKYGTSLYESDDKHDEMIKRYQNVFNKIVNN